VTVEFGRTELGVGIAGVEFPPSEMGLVVGELGGERWKVTRESRAGVGRL
jgi:hypothetical protein